MLLSHIFNLFSQVTHSPLVYYFRPRAESSMLIYTLIVQNHSLLFSSLYNQNNKFDQKKLNSRHFIHIFYFTGYNQHTKWSGLCGRSRWRKGVVHAECSQSCCSEVWLVCGERGLLIHRAWGHWGFWGFSNLTASCDSLLWRHDNSGWYRLSTPISGEVIVAGILVARSYR